jgi:hypothetical protein
MPHDDPDFGLPAVSSHPRPTTAQVQADLLKFGESRRDYVARLAKKTDTHPTEAQKESGRYRKGRISLHGMRIAIENPKGSIRSGKDDEGNTWETLMRHHYGYVERTEGSDEDPVDVFIGPNPESELVVIINQVDPKTKKFDEHKVMLGFTTTADAKKGYYACYESGWKGLGSASTITTDQFKWWLEHGDHDEPVEDGAYAKRKDYEEPAEKPKETSQSFGRSGPQIVARITMTSQKIIAMPDLAKLAEVADLPYRERTEMYALTPGGRLLSGIYPDASVGVFGGGIDEGEEAAAAWAPTTEYKSEKERERAKQFRGSRTQFVAGDLGRRVSDELEESNLADVKLRMLPSALVIQDQSLEGLEPGTEDYDRLQRRREVLLHLLAQREKEADDKTVRAYKQFRTLLSRPDELLPLFIGNQQAVPHGEWVEAENIPTKGFAPRPGWHAGALPSAPHLRSKEDRIQPGRVWAEVELPDDVDWQSIAEGRPTKDIRDEVPKGGHYRKRTPQMQGGEWLIGGKLRVRRVLSDDQISEILRAAGEHDAAEKERQKAAESTEDEDRQKEYDAETATINENKKGEGAKRHKFQRAKFLYPNMHPRCLLCGDEESISGQCKAAKDAKTPTVAVDLDGTLAKHYKDYDPDSIPDPRPGALSAMDEFKRQGYKVIVFTVRGNKKLVADWLDEHEIPYDHINENPDQPDDASDKVMADELASH